MASKFMRIKKLVIPVMAAIILTSQLTGCASVPSNVMLEMLNNGQDIEITLSVPDYEVSTIGDLQALEDIQLDQLQTYIDGGFREDFDTLFQIKPLALASSNSKSGCIYVNSSGLQEGNTSFMDSLRNKVFMETYLSKSEVQDKLAELAEKAYTDIDPDQAEAYLASLNAYYNLISDGQKTDNEYFNATQSLSRGDYYSFVYRATTPVNNLLKPQGDFKTKVNTQDQSALYASQVDQYAWLNADNDGLRAGNYNASISRAEAIYMLVNMYFQDELKAIDPATIQLTDAKDGGDFLEDTIEAKKESDQLYSIDKKSKDQTMAKGYQLGVISKMLKAQDNSVQTDLYKALGVANNLGLIESETRFNEPLSKSEAIDLMINTAKALNTRDGYLSEASEGTSTPSFDANAGQGVATDPNDPNNQYILPTDPSDLPIDPVDPSDYEKGLIDNTTGNTGNSTGNSSSTPESKPETKPVTPPASSKPTTPPASSKPTTPPKDESTFIPPNASSGGSVNIGGGAEVPSDWYEGLDSAGDPTKDNENAPGGWQ